MAVVPDTSDLDVARVAVVWEMVKDAMSSTESKRATTDPDARIKAMVNLFIRAYQAIANNEPIGEK